MSFLDHATPLAIDVEPDAGPGEHVSGVLVRPPSSRWLLVLGHGAGAGMHHPFMEETAVALAGVGVATLRYQFPYMEKGQRRPSPQPLLLATVRAAVRTAATLADGTLPLFAGGKSMGGRMTSLAAAAATLPDVRGLVFLGFPLHPAGSPSIRRAEHLAHTALPMLFVQGTRDKLATPELLRPVCANLGAAATLREIEGGDHSFAVLKRSGRTPHDVRDEIAGVVATWCGEHAS